MERKGGSLAMTEKEFRKVFEGTGWDVEYESDLKGARVNLKSGGTTVTAGTTWRSWEMPCRSLRASAFAHAAFDLSGARRPYSKSWTFPAWFEGDDPVETPAWCRDPETFEPRVKSVEEFAFKLSTLSEV